MNIQVNQLGAEILVTGGGVTHVNQVGIELLTTVVGGAASDVFTVTTMPSSPGPTSIQVSLNAQTSSTDSAYSGQMLTSAYESTFTEVTIFLPDLQDPVEQTAWLEFLIGTVKAQGVFQLQSQIESLIPANYSSRWWRVKPGPQTVSWTIGNIIESLTFTVRSLSALDVSYL